MRLISKSGLALLAALAAFLPFAAWAQNPALPKSDPLRPIMETHTIPPYPPLSVDLEEQGTTLMQVHITTQGVVDDCIVVQSSSSERLDQAACDHVRKTWRWQPPTAQGQPTNVLTRISVKWDLRDAPPPPAGPGVLRPIMATHTLPPYPPESFALNEQGTTMMEVNVTTQGVADSCKVVQSSGSERLDQAACDHVKQVWRWEPPVAGGQPVNVRTRVSVTWAIKTVKLPSP